MRRRATDVRPRITLKESFSFAWQGVKNSAAQRNFRIQLCVAALCVIANIILQVSATEWCIILGFCVLVLAAETFNTAIEAAVDLLSPEYDEHAKIAKDCAAGAVLILSIGALIAGLIIYITAFLKLVD